MSHGRLFSAPSTIIIIALAVINQPAVLSSARGSTQQWGERTGACTPANEVGGCRGEMLPPSRLKGIWPEWKGSVV